MVFSPEALKLAIAQPEGNVVYLARPCQYLDAVTQSQCEQSFWTEGRFSEPVIRSTSDALNVIKQYYASETISLVGFSGGGAVAVLVAARREDVRQIITVAGNLDHREWTNVHGLQPLDASLNAADEWQHVQNIPQLHYVGSADRVMPMRIAEAYRERFSDDQLINVQVISGFDHHCCWQQHWVSLSQDWPGN
jgi:pimeloyl-ACP methyl ester carboxylesterase